MVTEITTENESDEFYRMEQNSRRELGIKRSDSKKSAFVDFALEKDTFSIDEYALHTVFGARLLREQDIALRLLDRAALGLADLVSLEKEYQIFTLVTTQANFATGHFATLADELDDYVNGDPIGAFDTAIDRIVQSMGGSLPPGVVVKAAMGRDVHNAIKDHPDIKERVIYTGAPGQVADGALLAEFLLRGDGAEWVISDASLNAATETPDALSNPSSNTRLWSSTTDKICVAAVQMGLGNSAPGVGDITAFAAMRTFPPGVRRWQNAKELGNAAGPAEFVEAYEFWDLVTIAVDNLTNKKSVGAYLIQNCLT